MLFASGQIPVDPATGEVPEGITAQAEQSCKNVGAILAEAGLGYENVVKTTCFLADMADFAAFNEVYARTSEHRSMYSYVRLSIDRCNSYVRLSIDRCQLRTSSIIMYTSLWHDRCRYLTV